MLRKIFAATKPGGIAGVIDHVAAAGGDTRQIVDKLHRIDPAVVRADVERAGFVLDGESDLLRTPGDDKSKLVFDPSIRGKTDRFFYRFRKPARWSARRFLTAKMNFTGYDALSNHNLLLSHCQLWSVS